MAHKFEPKNMNKLYNEWRRQNLPPLPTIEKLGLTPSDIVADIGCGIGYFSIPAAEILNVRNKVFALDTSEEMLAEVEKRAAVANLSNVVTIKTEEYNLKLPDESVTFALLVNVLHEIEDKNKFIEDIKRILKVGGKLAIIEWEKTLIDMGPPLNHRIGKEEVENIIRKYEIKGISSMNFSEEFYGIVFTKEC
jgi:ubiquinone/menaquinone biosynthesis C-methylase UbiE